MRTSLRRARVLFPVAALPVAAVVAMPTLTRPGVACFAWTLANAPTTNRERLSQLSSEKTMMHTLAWTRRRRGK